MKNNPDIKPLRLGFREKVYSQLRGMYEEWRKRASEIGLKCAISIEAENWFEKGLIGKGEAIDDYYLNLNKEVKTITPEVIYQAINQISIESKHRSARLNAFNELEAIGLWLLMFSMRGMYPADITSLSSHNLDYNFASRIKHEQTGKDSELNLLGNSHVYRHGRHKTGFPMYRSRNGCWPVSGRRAWYYTFSGSGSKASQT